ncbi:MAG: FmdB family zinc ribbon protein, partial [Solirubrobacterales bacterium]
MPIYHYRCSKGHEFESLQSMSDDPLTECEECGAAVERVLPPPAVPFKGSGFYTT